MFDAHCHLHDERMKPIAAAAIARAHAAGVHGFLLAGVDPAGWLDEDALAAAHPDVSVSYGVHPQIVAAVDDATADSLLAALADRLSATSPGRHSEIAAVAIGEIGLDALDDDRKASLPRQERAFRAQLALARDLDLPVALHVLKAHPRALELLRADGLPRRGGMVHSYSGVPDQVPAYLALGLHVSFAGAVTYANARKTPEAARRVPPDRLLVETDAPDQTPEQHRSPDHRVYSEPAFLVAIVERLAKLRGESPEGLARSTEANARRLFGLPQRAQP